MWNRVLLTISLMLPIGSVWASAPLHPVDSRFISVSNLDPLRRVVDAGKRNLNWLNRVNTSRAIRGLPSLRLNAYPFGLSKFYTSASTPGSPLKYNGKTIENEFTQFLIKAPPKFLSRVMGQADSSSDFAGLRERDYLFWTATLDFLYSMACRWVYKRDFLSELSALAGKDLRGYLYFADNPDLASSESKLTRPRSLSALNNLCRNSGHTRSDCEQELRQALLSKTVRSYYQKYFPYGEKTWDDFFDIQQARPDILWFASAPTEAKLDFSDPEDEALSTWLKDTIESKWQWKDWKIALNFSSAINAFMPHLKLVPGVMPRVDSVGGSQITLDQNSALDDKGAEQTLQHEFGHVLGFPDCYLEFYDTAEQMMIYYELDKEDLMCSLSGNFLESHFEELKRNYLRD